MSEYCEYCGWYCAGTGTLRGCTMQCGAARRGAGHGQVMDDEQINNDLIEATLALVDRDFEPDGAVLIFLPGLQACGPDAPLRRGCAAAASSQRCTEHPRQ